MIRRLGRLLLVALIVALIGWGALELVTHSERERIYRTAWITTHLAEPVDSLVSVNFIFGGEVHSYSNQQLLDTTGENMLVADKSMPFPIRLTYHFQSGLTTELSTDSFDCHMCSGGHEYALWRDSVSYRYHP